MTNLCLKTKTIVLSFALILSGLFLACASDDPSTYAEKALREHITKYSNGKIQLVNFTKTNGVSGEGKYKIEYTAVIEFMEDCYQSSSPYESPYLVFMRSEGIPQLERKRSKGEKRTINSYMFLEKADNGWRVAQ